MFDPYRRRRERAASARASRMGEVDFSLPVDGDLPSLRTPSVKAGTLLDSIVAELVRDRSPFFDEVCAKWSGLFPGMKAKPGKWVAGATPSAGGRLFLNVRSAAASFALRPKLPEVKRRLSALASAPARFSVHIEIVSG